MTAFLDFIMNPCSQKQNEKMSTISSRVTELEGVIRGKNTEIAMLTRRLADSEERMDSILNENRWLP